jgi:MFS family permease
VETWYLAYALLGATVAGLVPVLLPLRVSRVSGMTQVGLVMAAVSLGGLTAPLWGGLADRYRLHRWLLSGGLAVTAAGLAAFAFTTDPIVWTALALLQGIGAAAAATVANLFVVEVHPQIEWDTRIGWLQTFYGGGQVVGLLLAGLLGQTYPRLGLLTAAGLPALALLPGWLGTPRIGSAPRARPILRHPVRHGEWAVSSPARLFHHCTWRALRALGASAGSPFGRFLGAWLLGYAGAASVFSLYPVLMEAAFGVPAGTSSLAFGAAAGLGMALYSPAGTWAGRAGSLRVLQAGLGLRVLAFGVLLALALTHPLAQGALALLAFGAVVLAWSLLSVGGTALTAELSRIGEGEALGLFNAATALAGVIGAALGGWIAGRWGVAAALGLAVLGAGCAFFLAAQLGPARQPVAGQAPR